MSVAAIAAEGTASAQQGIGSMVIMFGLFIVIFYFLLVRPQQKRAKEQKSLMDSVAIGDEVVTAGGIVARITKLREGFVVLAIAEGVEMTLQKSSISAVLPKGTLDSARS
ncbi:MAG: preprotein translocase subunit YajC [Coxiellaceae bacterium]|nr:preprotein translocase subunit YajC [Coxiellaceae bacterium]